jgi:hypothetical protein
MAEKTRPDLVLLEARIAIVKKLVDDQAAEVSRLLDEGESVINAEQTLKMYISSLRHLESRAKKLRAGSVDSSST